MPTDLRRLAREVVQIVVVTALLFLVVNTLVAQPFEVQQRSMEPTLGSGDHILIDKLTTRWSPYARGDVIVFHAPGQFDAAGIPYVKRIVGMPGDTIQIENGRIFVTPPGGVPIRLEEAYLADGEASLPQGIEGRREWTVPENAYFVLGDNRSDSVDSRTFGAVPHDRIVGRAWLRYLPIDRVRLIGTDEG
ncbi:MAG TPA: signal peptidase I [Candidatus Limnocylindrales bacterium]|nr:signal peptidase I [Candidatus Limnocylindrales bacterium]